MQYTCISQSYSRGKLSDFGIDVLEYVYEMLSYFDIFFSMSHFSAVQNVAEYYRKGRICFCDKRTSFAYGNSARTHGPQILSRNIDREAMSQSSSSNVKSHTS